jgi:hypothetical protein
MLYENINDYINSQKDFNNELWVFDNEFSKDFIIKSLNNKFEPQSTSIDNFFTYLEKKNKKEILSEIEVKILTEKIISKNKELKFIEKQNSLLSGFIELLKVVRLYPSFGTKNINDSLKHNLKIIYELYRKNVSLKISKTLHQIFLTFQKKIYQNQITLKELFLLVSFFT